MSGNYILDTNIVIALFRNDQAVKEQIEMLTTIHISSIVLGELYYGAEKSARVTENVNRIERFIEDVVIFSSDGHTAILYGSLKNKLRAKGKPIPENDIWIAAIALQHDLTLVSRDDHFRHVDTLNVIKW